jgi:DNA-formamidopyrimidine glycosylase
VPELPEVETTRRQLEPHLVGRRFDRVEIGDPRLVRPFEPGAVAAELEGERVSALERRGKYLIVRFESGRALLIHLRMTGSLRHAANGELADDPHRRAVVRLDDGSDVAYRDVRRFGTWQLLEPGELDPYLEDRLGSSRSSERSRRDDSVSNWKAAAHRSRLRSSISERWPGSETSTSTKRCGGHRSIHFALLGRSTRTSSRV